MWFPGCDRLDLLESESYLLRGSLTRARAVQCGRSQNNYIQRKVREINWNPSNLDTIEVDESVDISQVFLFQGLNCMQDMFLRERKGVLM